MEIRSDETLAELIKATDNLNEGRLKLNNAITDSEKALNTANTAKATADLSKAESESTQTQLDTIVIEGDSSVEAAQARVDSKGVSHTTLKSRIDNFEVSTAQQLAETEQDLTAQLQQTVKKSDLMININDFERLPEDNNSDSPRFFRAIQYLNQQLIDGVLFSNKTNNTNIGGEIFVPNGIYNITEEIVIGPSFKPEEADSVNSVAGITLVGESYLSTIFDCKNMTTGNGIKIQGANAGVKNLQIKNAPYSGIDSSGWGNTFEKVFVQTCGRDGISISDGFKLIVSKCLFFKCAEYGLSFNNYHTSVVVENNYALSCVKGGYFVGNRENIGLSMGMTYSTFNANACDGGVDAFTLAGCRSVVLNGNGCEVISRYALRITGTGSNISINGFFGDRVSGFGVYLEGVDMDVSINGYIDSNPPNVTSELFAGGGINSKLSIKNIKNNRERLVRETANVITQMDTRKNKKTVTFSSRGAIVGTLSHPWLYKNNYGGKIMVRVMHGSSYSPATDISTGLYELAINKGAGTGETKLVTIAEIGKGPETMPLATCSFIFSFDSTTNNLIATHTNTTDAWVSRSFSFVIETFGDIVFS